MAISWTLNSGVLTISGTGAMDNYDSGNHAPWYENRTSITSVVIENGVTSIGDYAFNNCRSLTSVTIPNSVTSINIFAFTYCTNLTNVTIPDSVTSIGSYAFHNCDNLTAIDVDVNNTSYSSVDGVFFNKAKTNLIKYPAKNSRTSYTIPDSVTRINEYAFSNCINLTNVTIPNTVTYIDYYAFFSCPALTSVTIPSSVTTIQYQAFSYCNKLAAINVDVNNTSYSSVDGVLFNKAKTNLIQYPIGNSRTNYTIPNSVTKLEDAAFARGLSLTNIIIPDSITKIGNYTFKSCTALTDVYYSGNETEWDAITINNNNESLTNAIIHYNYNYIIANGYCGGEGDGTNLSWTLNDKGVLTISGTGVMKDYTSTTAPWYENKNTIISVIIEDGVTNIGFQAFNSCTVLTNITIPNSVTNIGAYALNSCTALTSVDIPDSVINIGNGAFNYCSKLETINVDVNNTSYSSINGVLFNKAKTTLIQYPIGNSRTSYAIPNDVTDIGYSAFANSVNLTDVTISSSVTSISTWAFMGCSSLETINVDTNNTSYSSVDGVLFNKAKTNLIQYPIGNSRTNYTIPNGITNIDNDAFRFCSILTNVTIPNGVTNIGNYAFYYCTEIMSITIPNSVTNIGNRTFDGCDELTDVYYTGSETDWNATTIDNYNEPLANATIHYNYSPIVASGYCGGEGDGTNLSWTLDDQGVLTISGTGAMENFTALARVPWNMNRNSITSIIIEDSVTNIGNYAFKQCSTLTNIIIPNSITSIGMQAFYNCSALTNITIPDNTTSIGQQTFFGCTSLTSIAIPDDITNIGKQTFYNCSALTNITIPDSITNIGDSAFYGCSALTDVYYSGNETDWNAITIGTQNELLLNATIHYNLTYLVTKAELTSIANAIRAKTGTTSKYTWPSQMISAIGEIPQLDTTDATATTADILDGKTAYVNGEKITGTHVPDGYQILNGTITAEEPTMDLFFEDLSFEPEGAVIYHKASQNATYAVNGNYLLLFGYGTTENSHNIALSWKSNANKQSAFYIDWYEEVLSLTTDGRFNGPYNYIIWGK